MSSIPVIDPLESPRARARRKLACLAYRNLAELVDDLVEADAKPVSVSVACKSAGVRLVMRWVKFSGPAWEPAERKEEKRLTWQQRDILAACNREVPTISKKIAKALGKSEVTSYLRKQLRFLVRRGRLKRFGGGYLLA